MYNSLFKLTITKLNLEDSFSEEFSLLAIHTDLEDFRLAYFLNKTLGLNLSRKEMILNPLIKSLRSKDSKIKNSSYRKKKIRNITN